MATMWGWRLFYSELPIVQLLFESSDYLRVTSIWKSTVSSSSEHVHTQNHYPCSHAAVQFFNVCMYCSVNQWEYFGQRKTLCNSFIQKRGFGLTFESGIIFGAFMEVYEPPFFFCCSLTFCSLSRNEIKAEGVRELAGALQVNQSLRQLEWVQPFFSLVPRPRGRREKWPGIHCLRMREWSRKSFAN